MPTRLGLLLLTGCLAAAIVQSERSTLAQGAGTPALTGVVTSSEEGQMEGVLVSAKKADSTLTITVVSDETGRYRFPSDRLGPGRYTLRVRAIGFDLEGPAAIELSQAKAATLDLKLVKAKDLSAQLTNAEWLASFPGTEEQKGGVRGCAHCHMLDLMTRSRHDADEFMAVAERMAGYPPLAFPLMPQRTPAPRIGGGPVNAERQQASRRRQAEYLATLNLSNGPQWSYQFKTFARPKGAATRVIYTEYALPKRTRQPHDVIVDSTGMVWYASFGEQILAKVDPKTGQSTEYDIPVMRPNAPKGMLGVRFDEDENIWMGAQFQRGIVKFDKKTEKFTTYPLPPEYDGDHVQINQIGPGRHHVDGKVWVQDAGTYTILRVDTNTGKWDMFEPFKIPRPNVYDIVPDKMNNGWYLPLGSEEVGKIDAKTGQITRFKTPTKGSGPRRGMMDSEERLWFGENNADKIGMFDTKSQTFKEWPAPTPGAWPYDVTADKNGEVWSGGEYNDRILRLNPASGQIVEYLLPQHTNVRRVFVDNSTTPVTFWVGSNHGASIVKLEPLDGRVGQTSR
jgi:virginiamycin B lyase